MLIKVFGIWLIMSNGYLEEYKDIFTQRCSIHFSQHTGYSSLTFEDKTCDQVAIEINKQIKESK